MVGIFTQQKLANTSHSMFTTSRAGCARTHPDTTESYPGSEEIAPGKWCLLGIGCGDGRMFQDEETAWAKAGR